MELASVTFCVSNKGTYFKAEQFVNIVAVFVTFFVFVNIGAFCKDLHVANILVNIVAEVQSIVFGTDVNE